MSAAAPVTDRRTARREETRRQIRAAAWELARERGMGGWAMRDLGARLGIRAQSLYVYYPSKHALLDAMFAEGYQALTDRLSGLPEAADPVAALRGGARAFVQFATEDTARYQLLFQRVVPGFEPSAESYDVSVRSLQLTRSRLAACGITSARDLDLFTAVMAGVVAQQNSNEPGGTRWARLVDTAVDMYLAHVTRGRKAPS